MGKRAMDQTEGVSVMAGFIYWFIFGAVVGGFVMALAWAWPPPDVNVAEPIEIPNWPSDIEVEIQTTEAVIEKPIVERDDLDAWEWEIDTGVEYLIIEDHGTSVTLPGEVLYEAGPLPEIYRAKAKQ